MKGSVRSDNSGVFLNNPHLCRCCYGDPVEPIELTNAIIDWSCIKGWVCSKCYDSKKEKLNRDGWYLIDVR